MFQQFSILQKSHPTVGLQQKVPELLTWGTQYPARKMTSKSFGRTTRPKLLCLSPKIKCTREIASLTGSSSHEELNHPGTFWRKTCNPYRGMTQKCFQQKNGSRYRSTYPLVTITRYSRGLWLTPSSLLRRSQKDVDANTNNKTH